MVVWGGGMAGGLVKQGRSIAREATSRRQKAKGKQRKSSQHSCISGAQREPVIGLIFVLIGCLVYK